MSTPLADIVFDSSIYPRAEWSQTTVNHYIEALTAGAQFPPVVIEEETNRLLDGVHRWQAHQQADYSEIPAEYHVVPDGVPAKLYSASLSTTHGDRISGSDLREIAREVASANPDFNMQTVARYCGVTRQTVGRWIGDITERRRTVRKVSALLLSRAGWSNRRIAEKLEVSKGQVDSDVKDDIPVHLTEDILRDALDGLPEECAHIAEQIREEQIFANWTDEERTLLKRLRGGETLVVNQRDGTHNNLIEWADAAGMYTRVDRRTEWGNPFELGKDGDRDTVISNYRDHYLPNKPSLLNHLADLAGHALGCWCAPEPCHADILRHRVEEQR